MSTVMEEYLHTGIQLKIILKNQRILPVQAQLVVRICVKDLAPRSMEIKWLWRCQALNRC